MESNIIKLYYLPISNIVPLLFFINLSFSQTTSKSSIKSRNLYYKGLILQHRGLCPEALKNLNEFMNSYNGIGKYELIQKAKLLISNCKNDPVRLTSKINKTSKNIIHNSHPNKNKSVSRQKIIADIKTNSTNESKIEINEANKKTLSKSESIPNEIKSLKNNYTYSDNFSGYKVYIGSYKTDKEVLISLSELGPIYNEQDPTLVYNYYIGHPSTLKEANELIKNCKKMGFSNSEIQEYNKGIIINKFPLIDELKVQDWFLVIGSFKDPSNVKKLEFNLEKDQFKTKKETYGSYIRVGIIYQSTELDAYNYLNFLKIKYGNDIWIRK